MIKKIQKPRIPERVSTLLSGIFYATFDYRSPNSELEDELLFQ